MAKKTKKLLSLAQTAPDSLHSTAVMSYIMGQAHEGRMKRMQFLQHKHKPDEKSRLHPAFDVHSRLTCDRHRSHLKGEVISHFFFCIFRATN